jgi:hypothetical protein
MQQTVDPCPTCHRPMTRLGIEDLFADMECTTWTKRFADPFGGLSAGRYRCDDCVSEWWQFPAKIAS